MKSSTPSTPSTPAKGSHRGTLIRKPTVIDLFAGVGLFGYGFACEGFRISCSYEFDKMTAGVNAMNSHSPVVVCDLAHHRPSGRCDVLIAGPPCQGFSSIGSKYARDPRNSLCLVIPAWAEQTKAKIVAVENVPRFNASPSWTRLCEQMETLGYAFTHEIVNARRFGVAQNRNRFITIFSKRRLPLVKNQEWSTEITVGDALAELPQAPYPKLQHFTRPRSKQAMERIRLVPYGGDIRDIYAVRPDLVPPSWVKVKDKIVDIWGRLTWEGVSNTIRTGFLNPSRGRSLHPTEDRPLTFREAARLQSVPDSFQFSGLAEQMARQIGNGVPVNLARAIARSVREIL